VDDVVAGCVTPAGDQASDVGRLATLKAGFPIDVPGVQINRFCGSGQQAIHFAAAGHPLGRHGYRHRLRRGEHEPGSHVQRRTVQSGVIADFPYGIVHQGISAEMLGRQVGSQP